MHGKRAVLLLTAAVALTAPLPPAIGAVLTVTNLADSGPGTLRDRLAASAPGDVIYFGVFGTVLLNSELTISRSIFLGQFGAEMVVISGNRACRVFNVTGGIVVRERNSPRFITWQTAPGALAAQLASHQAR
jgi:hypothetical protein